MTYVNNYRCFANYCTSHSTSANFHKSLCNSIQHQTGSVSFVNVNCEVISTQVKTVQLIGNITLFLLWLLKKKVFSETHTVPTAILFSETKTLWVVRLALCVTHTHTHTITLMTGLVQIWSPTRNWDIDCSLKETQQIYGDYCLLKAYARALWVPGGTITASHLKSRREES